MCVIEKIIKGFYVYQPLVPASIWPRREGLSKCISVIQAFSVQQLFPRKFSVQSTGQCKVSFIFSKSYFVAQNWQASKGKL